MLKYRLISASFLIPIIISALFFLSPMKLFIFVLTICMLATWEWGKISNYPLYTERILLVFLYGLPLSIILFLFTGHYRNIYQPIIMNLSRISLIWWIFSLFLILFYPKSSIIWKRFKIFRFISGLLVIVPFFCGVIVLRDWNYDKNCYIGISRLLYIIVLVWGIDSSSYIFGKLFGKHKLVPKISPEKTWQGLIGGFVAAIVISWNYGTWIDIEITKFTLCTYSIVITFSSVLGDLTESMLKREAGIKDSSQLIPGHGGILDRLDSLSASVPVFACLINT